jgi:hypothetical protein
VDLVTGVDDYLQPRLLLRGPIEHLAQPLGLRRVHGRNFYAGVRQDSERLESYLSLRTKQDFYLDSFLKENGLAIEVQAERRRRIERLELDLFWHRSQRSWGRAFSTWRNILRLCGWRPYSIFKAFVLALALARPSLYFRLGRIYENQAWLPKLRAKLLP